MYLINSENEPTPLIKQIIQQTGTKNGNKIIKGIIKTKAPVILFKGEWVAANRLNFIAATIYAKSRKNKTNTTAYHITVGKIFHKNGIIIINITA